MTSQTYLIPDVLKDWPWTRHTNPHLQAEKEESAKWLESFKPFTPRGQAAFNACDFGLLSALSFPDCGAYDFRSCCDLNNLFFCLDDQTDTASLTAVQAICEAAKDAVMHPDKPRPDDEHSIGEMSRQFWNRARVNPEGTISHFATERFVESWCAYVDSVVEQAGRRDTRHVCSVDEYFVSRRENIGVRPSLALIEAYLKLEIPHDVMEHPAIQSLVRDATDIVIIGNDLASYKKEVLAGDADYNLVTVIMAERTIGLGEAVEAISAMCAEVTGNFLATVEDIVQHKNGIPSWGKKIDEHIALYIEGLGLWVRGVDEWYFESKRYFGDNGLRIKESRLVTIS